MATSRGEQALARVLTQLANAAVERIQRAENPEAVAPQLWAAFKEAVGAAQSEIRASELEGFQQWQRARHAKQG